MECRPTYKGIDILTRKECQLAIDEARLNRLDADIAEMYYIERMAQADISVALGIARSTISRKLPIITQRIEYTAERLKQI